MIKITYTDEFRKEYKALAKKHRSLWDLEWWRWDFHDFKLIVEDNPIGSFCKRIDGLGEDIIPVYKVKKFYCASLRSTTELRLIYSYNADLAELQLIEFLEIYAKADKENENRERIKKYCKR